MRISSTGDRTHEDRSGWSVFYYMRNLLLKGVFGAAVLLVLKILKVCVIVKLENNV